MAILKQPYSNLDGIENNFPILYGENSSLQRQRYDSAFNNFKQYFSVENAYIASSSGRVEVCGNHTDHNGGLVVSCAISLDTLAFFLPVDSNVIKIKSEGYPEILIDLNKPSNEKIGTSDAIVRGVCEGIKNKGYKVGGFIAYITSNVLGGAGISSSASFEVLIAEILNFLYNNGEITNEEKAIVSQFAENVYFGKPCGLLDQTAIAFGGLKKLDFSNKESIKVEDIKGDLSNWTLVLINTGGSHADLTDEYASIPSEMKLVAKAFGKERLVEIDKNYFFENLPQKVNDLPDRAILRAIHFFEENERVDSLCKALAINDFKTFIDVIKSSGISSLTKLQNCYVAGSSEQLIPRALSISGNYLNGGANRVHGGGFAGTILNVVSNSDVDAFVDKMKGFFGQNNVIPLKVRSTGVIVL
jgi:galactokinase